MEAFMKYALVTGAFGGMGKSAVRRLTEKGYMHISSLMKKCTKSSLSTAMLEANFCWICIESTLEIGFVQQPLPSMFIPIADM